MQLLRARDYRRMPWKIGGGETVEIAVFPANAGVDGFDWRISMATVATNGPFSIFPGIDRTLSILSGEGMTLSIGNAPPVSLTKNSQPLPFAADAPTEAILANGSITDLNVMTRQGVFRHSVEVRTGRLQISPQWGQEAVFVMATGPSVVSSDSQCVTLEALDAVRLDRPAEIDAGKDAAYIISLTPV